MWLSCCFCEYSCCSLYRNGAQSYIIPAKLPPGVEDIHWQTDDPNYIRYTGLRIECHDGTDMFTADVFPCIQVCMMNQYQQEGVTPKLSCFGLKIFDKVEGMLQLTKDKRAIHIAVRETQKWQQEGAKEQLLKMKELVLEELKQRSEGTKINICYLSSVALRSSSDIATDVYWFDETRVEAAEQKRSSLVVSDKLVEETVQSVKGCLAEHQGENNSNNNAYKAEFQTNDH